MPCETKGKPPGVTVTQYEADATDCCNFHREDSHSTCDKPAVTAVIVTDTNGHGVLLKLCRRHLSRLSIHLIEKLE